MYSSLPGQVTDDSEMAMSSAYAIMDSPELSEINQDILYYYYGIWKSTDPNDIGHTVSSAFQFF